jgi:hypothetical protein
MLCCAETFCLNCGILALDEPTTNLDAGVCHEMHAVASFAPLFPTKCHMHTLILSLMFHGCVRLHPYATQCPCSCSYHTPAVGLLFLFCLLLAGLLVGLLTSWLLTALVPSLPVSIPACLHTACLHTAGLPVNKTENSASLADALRAVMAARREQDNFQLIVITHDEHFAHLIGKSKPRSSVCE